MQLLARRRQADQVEVEPAEQDVRLGRRQGHQASPLALAAEEGVDRVADPGRHRAASGTRGPDRRQERPVLARVGLGPLVRRRRRPPGRSSARKSATCSAVSGGPSGGIRCAGSVSVTRSMSRLSPACPGSIAGPLSPPRRIDAAGVEAQPGLLLQRPVAGVAALLQDRLDLAGVVDRLGSPGDSHRYEGEGHQEDQARLIAETGP